MNKFLLKYLVSTLLIFSHSYCFGASLNVLVEAIILPNSSISSVNSLSFGAISIGNTVASVEISPSGELQVDGQISVRDQSATTAGKIVIKGIDGVDFTISLPSQVLLTNSSGDTMVVNSLTSENGEKGRSENSNISVGIGGTLNIKPSQPAGNYQGSLRVDVNY